MARFLVLSAVSLTLCGCGAFDKLDNMNRATSDMSQTTSDMSHTMGGMKEKTDGLYALTLSLFRDNRQAVSQQARRDNLADALAARSLGLRVRSFAIFFNGMEFQLWENTSWDTYKIRNDLFDNALMEMKFVIKGITNGEMPDPDPSPTCCDNLPRSKDDTMVTMLALAAASDYVNPIQVVNAEKTGFTELSTLDLMINSLKYKKMNDGKKEFNATPKWADTGLGLEREITYLLQLRYNMLAGLAADDLFGLGGEDNWRHRIGLGLKAKFLHRKNDVDTTGMNAAVLEEAASFYLAGALYLKNQIKDLNIHLKLNDNLAAILKSANLVTDHAAGENKSFWTGKLNQAIIQLTCETCPPTLGDAEVAAMYAVARKAHTQEFVPQFNEMHATIDKRINSNLNQQLNSLGYSDYRQILNRSTAKTTR